MKSFFDKLYYKWSLFRVRFVYTRQDNLPIPLGNDEIRLFAMARNESLRLSYFLKYYSEMGVNRIFLIDNDSSDSTTEIALSYPNVHVFKIKESFKKSWYWIEYFLKKYGKNRWCMVVDIDELFSYPYAEIVSLRTLIKYMEQKKFDAIQSFFLDMYSNKPIIETDYLPNKNPIDRCPYFDLNYYVMKVQLFDKKRWEYFTAEIFTGGMRDRVFNKLSGTPISHHLSKISLFKNTPEVYLTGGMHAINGANLADINGVVFHTKYMCDFIERVRIEAKREVHHRDAYVYKNFDIACSVEPNLSLIDQNSVKYENTRQLLKLRIMKTSVKFHNFLVELDLNFEKLFVKKNAEELT
jgi:hypothetical protein